MMNHVKDSNETVEKIAAHFEEIIKLLGEDTAREGLLKTPIRAAKALYKSTKGYRADAIEIAKQAIFEHAGSKMIIVKDIEFYSFCEHHILPFFGRVSIDKETQQRVEVGYWGLTTVTEYGNYIINVDIKEVKFC